MNYLLIAEDIKQTLQTLQPLLLSLQKSHDSENREIRDALQSSGDAKAKSGLVLQAKLVFERQKLLVTLFHTHIELAAKVRNWREDASGSSSSRGDRHSPSNKVANCQAKHADVDDCRPVKERRRKRASGAVKRSVSLSSAELQPNKRKVSRRPVRGSCPNTQVDAVTATGDDSLNCISDINTEIHNDTVVPLAEKAAMNTVDTIRETNVLSNIAHVVVDNGCAKSVVTILRANDTPALQQEAECVLSCLQLHIPRQDESTTPALARSVSTTDITSQQSSHTSPPTLTPITPTTTATFGLISSQSACPCPNVLNVVDLTDDPINDAISSETVAKVTHLLPKRKKTVTLKKLLNAGIIHAGHRVLSSEDQV